MIQVCSANEEHQIKYEPSKYGHLLQQVTNQFIARAKRNSRYMFPYGFSFFT